MKFNLSSFFAPAVFTGILSLYSCNHQQQPMQLSASAPVGSVIGQYAVNDNGNSTYTIAITSPPGTAQVQPNLSLSYNSRAKNGMLGAGWELSGLSLITRIGCNIATDGITRGISLDSGDRFALDGQRLIAYRDSAGQLLRTQAERDGAYGRNGTEYRTEVESWTRIFSSGSCGGGPCAFTAWSKDGSRTDYAVTADSRFEVAGTPAVLMWAVGRVTDRNGNYVQVRYNKDSLSGNFLPDNIVYTGNEQGGLSPGRMIRFRFESREDTIFQSVAGIRLICSRRLSGIETFVDADGDGRHIDDPANRVLDYRIGYSYSPSTHRSLVSKVEECDAAGHCLPGTQFQWSGLDSLGEFAGINDSLPGSFWPLIQAKTQSVKADFNGDGRTDIALFNQDALNIPILFSHGEAGFTTTQYNLPPGFNNFFSNMNAAIVLGDFNGDGLTDIAQIIPGQHHISILLSKGDGHFDGIRVSVPPELDSAMMDNGVSIIAGDFNGDGLTDLAGFKTGYGTVPVLFMQADNTFTGTRLPLPPGFSGIINVPGIERIVSDFNGDGRMDLAFFKTGYATVPVLLSNGDGSFRGSSWKLEGYKDAFNSADVEKVVGDFNGDGLPDIAAFKRGYTSVPILFSLGNGQFYATKQPMPAGFSSSFNDDGVRHVTGDFNGDGLTDLAAFRQGYTTIPLLYSRGSGAFTGIRKNMPSGFASIINAPDIQRLIGDFNGDGMMDISGFKPGYKSLPVLFCHKPSTGDNQPDLMTVVRDGIGAVWSTSYSPLTDSSVYQKDSTAHYPVVDVQPASFVVSRDKSWLRGEDSLPIKGISYRFRGATIDLHRGWIGFRQTMRIDPLRDTRTVTDQYQRFPLSGMIAQREITALDRPAEILGKVGHTFGYENADGAGVFHIWQTSYKIWHYTRGVFNFLMEKEFTYDTEHKNILRIANTGPPGTGPGNLYEFIDYDSSYAGGTNWWKTFLPVARKTRRSPDSCRWDRWDALQDISWEKYAYDGRGNSSLRQLFRDRNGRAATMDWLSFGTSYDLYGNAIAQTRPAEDAPDGVTDSTVYDAIYHSFPVQVITAAAGDGDTVHLRSTLAYESHFGINISIVDPNGNRIYAIPSGGIDGVGRILQVQGTDPFEDSLRLLSVTTYQPDPVNGNDVHVYNRTAWEGPDSPDDSWLWEETHYDAKGNLLRTRRKGPAAGNDIISGQELDSAGMTGKEFIPFYSRDSAAGPLYFQQLYNRQGYPTTTLAPDPAIRGRHFVWKAYSYDSTDDRRVFIRQPDPTRHSQAVIWRLHMDEYNKVVGSEGPFDESGQPLPGFSSNTFRYDASGRLAEVIDPLGTPIRYEYNSIGQKISEQREETATTYYSYAPDGQLGTMENAAGAITRYRYDHLGRLILRTVQPGGGSAKDSSTWLYDDPSTANGIGRLSLCSFHGGYYRYQYDRVGNVDQTLVYVDSLHTQFISRSDYDALGRLRSGLTPDSMQARYVYGRDGHLASILLNGDTLASFGDYTAAGAAGGMHYRNGVVSRFDYDLLGRPSHSVWDRQAFTARDFRYHWNLAGKLDSIIDQRIYKEPDLSQSFRYDPAGRLVAAMATGQEDNFSYDASGNRLTDRDYTYHYSPQKKNELIEAVQRNGTGGYTLSYDSIGNIVKEHYYNTRRAGRKMTASRRDRQSRGAGTAFQESDSVIYHYSANGAMTGMDQFADSLQAISRYQYGPDRNRFIKWDPNGVATFYISPVFQVTRLVNSSLEHTAYVANAGGILYARTDTGKGSLLRDLQPPGRNSFRPFNGHSHPAAGKVQASMRSTALLLLSALSLLVLMATRLVARERLTFGRALLMLASLLIFTNPVLADLQPGPNGPGIPVAGTEIFYHQDYLGSTMFLTDAQGGLTSGMEYEPFGGVIGANSSGTNDFRQKFTGKELESKKGLYYSGSRYYDSRQGRFLSPDPANQYFSPYIYGNNDPMGGVDPNGEEFIMAIALVTAAIVGAFVGAAVLNGSLNPIDWDWLSAKTWVGLITGAAAGIATVASGGAAMSSFGLVAAESVAVSGMSAGSIALSSLDIAFLTYDAYAFAEDPSLVNGLAVGLDIIPFAGQLLGRLSHGAELTRAADNVVDEGKDLYKAAATEVDNSVCIASFQPGTGVYTGQGEQPIEKVQVGDRVWGKSDSTGRPGLYAVSKVLKHLAAAVVVLTLNSDTLVATPNHPFYVTGKGWTETAALHPGDRLQSYHAGDHTDSGDPVVISVRPADRKTYVYNLEIEGAHSYYIGRSHTLVHNPKCVITRYTQPGPGGQRIDHIETDADISTYQQGSATNRTMRNLVNNPATDVPTSIDYGYTVIDPATGITITSRNHNVLNPAIAGANWDAGHAVGRQHGGSGTDPDNIFAQNREINRGNNGMYRVWRRLEDRVAGYQQQYIVHMHLVLYF